MKFQFCPFHFLPFILSLNCLSHSNISNNIHVLCYGFFRCYFQFTIARISLASLISLLSMHSLRFFIFSIVQIFEGGKGWCFQSLGCDVHNIHQDKLIFSLPKSWTKKFRLLTTTILVLTLKIKESLGTCSCLKGQANKKIRIKWNVEWNKFQWLF